MFSTNARNLISRGMPSAGETRGTPRSLFFSFCQVDFMLRTGLILLALAAGALALLSLPDMDERSSSVSSRSVPVSRLDR